MKLMSIQVPCQLLHTKHMNHLLSIVLDGAEPVGG